MAEHRLSLAVTGRENLLYQKLITCRTADRAAAGQKNGYQVTAGSVAIAGLGYVALPTAVDSSKVNAAYKDGILTVILSKAEEAKPKQIKVNVS